MIDFLLYTMEYKGDFIDSDISLKQYTDCCFEEYKRIYEDCFFEMRSALGLLPINACDSREELLKKSNDIYIYIENGSMIGSVAIFGNEIDELIVAKEFQRKGYGQMLLNFAISHIQKNSVSPISLCVTDWNKGAINMYLKNGFQIMKTEQIKGA